MSASNKILLTMLLVLAAASGACSSLVSVDRTKIEDDMFVVPEKERDAGSDEDAG